MMSAKRPNPGRGVGVARNAASPKTAVEPRPAPPSIRHPSIPELPRPMGELFYECTLFLYSAIALFWQYWNLYKALWWVPKAYVHYYAKLHLIDPYVLSCVGLILGRRVTWCFFKSIPDALIGDEENGRFRWVEWLTRLVMLTVVMSSFAVNFLKVIQTHSTHLLLSLLAPVLVTYVFLFYSDMSAGGVGGSGEGGLWERLSRWLESETYLVDPTLVRHACSSSASAVREEVDVLSRDLRERAKQAVFSAFSVAYFAVLVPCFFAPSEILVDWWWAGELGLVVFLSALCLYLAFLFPLQYCQILHQSATHIGRWEWVGAATGAAAEWSDSEVYSQGATVESGGSEWRAGGESVAAVPGEQWAAVVEWVGREPLRLLNGLCGLCFGLLAWTFLLLIHSAEWQHIFTLVFLLPANYIALFFLFKDKVILGRIYHPSAEDLKIR